MSIACSSSVPTITGSVQVLSAILSSACLSSAWSSPLVVTLSGTAILPGGSGQHNLYNPRVNLLTVAVVLVLSVDAATGAGGNPSAALDGGAWPAPAALAGRIDELHRRRDDRSAFSEEQRLVQAGLARTPNDYGLLWRAARFYFWASDDPSLPNEQRSRWGKDGWDIAEH